MNTTLDNFERALVGFIMTQPPAGDRVCRMNKATVGQLINEMLPHREAWTADRIKETLAMGRGLDADHLPAVPPDVCGIVCGVQIVYDNSLADGEFAFSVRVKGLGELTGPDFAGPRGQKWERVDVDDIGSKLRADNHTFVAPVTVDSGVDENGNGWCSFSMTTPLREIIGPAPLQDALADVLMAWGPTFSSADAIQDRLDKLVDLVRMPDRAGEADMPGKAA